MVTHPQQPVPLQRVYSGALDHFGQLRRAVRPGQWQRPTPCAQWTVRDLVNHLTVEHLWAAELLSGIAATAVGDRLEGDQLGDDPLLAFKRAAVEAEGRVHTPGAPDATVRLWSGPSPARYLISRLATDTVVHSWDLARATGSDEHLPAGLVAFTLGELSGHADRLTDSGLFDPPPPVPDDTDSQTRLLALTGRDATRAPQRSPRETATRAAHRPRGA